MKRRNCQVLIVRVTAPGAVQEILVCDKDVPKWLRELLRRNEEINVAVLDNGTHLVASGVTLGQMLLEHTFLESTYRFNTEYSFHPA